MSEPFVPLPKSTFAGDAFVLPALFGWQRAGLATALVTLTGIDGRSPRPLGAQMAIAAGGPSAGYLSGGCLEAAVVEEAQRVIADGRATTLRYGRGSPYFDLKLPCGSGLDLYFAPHPDADLIAAAVRAHAERRAFTLVTDLASGQSRIEALAPLAPDQTEVAGGILRRVYRPAPRVLVAGSGPVVVALADLFQASGLALLAVSPDAATRDDLIASGHAGIALPSPEALPTGFLDAFGAAILAFHHHDWEAPLLKAILATPCFYAGALGSHTAHAARVEAMRALGVAEADIGRVRGPIGLIANARSRVSLAAGILAEVVTAAKARGLMD